MVSGRRTASGEWLLPVVLCRKRRMWVVALAVSSTGARVVTTGVRLVYDLDTTAGMHVLGLKPTWRGKGERCGSVLTRLPLVLLRWVAVVDWW